MDEKNKTQRGRTPEPAETGRDNQQHEHKAHEGDYRNAQSAGSQQSKVNIREPGVDNPQSEVDSQESEVESRNSKN